jgi:hypothetical protein
MENTDQSKVEGLNEALQILDEDERYFIEETKDMNPMELMGNGDIIKGKILAKKYDTTELERRINLVYDIEKKTNDIYSKKASELARKKEELKSEEERWNKIWLKTPNRTENHDDKISQLKEEIKTMEENLGENISHQKFAGRLRPYYIAKEHKQKNQTQTGAKKKKKNKTKKKSKIRKSKKNKRSKKSKKK